MSEHPISRIPTDIRALLATEHHPPAPPVSLVGTVYERLRRSLHLVYPWACLARSVGGGE